MSEGELKPGGTPFENALALQAEGKSPKDILETLKAGGLDAESASVVVNSLPGAPMPSQLPEAKFSLPTNPLAPESVALSDIGLTGDPRVVGRYWIAFGVVLGVIAGLTLLANEAKVVGETRGLAVVFANAGFVIGAVAVVVGLLKLVRRR